MPALTPPNQSITDPIPLITPVDAATSERLASLQTEPDDIGFIKPAAVPQSGPVWVAARQSQIIQELGILSEFDVATETEKRIQFLVDYIIHQRLHTFVIGVSGGVDSTTAGKLCSIAAKRVRERGRHASCIAVRLPYHTQFDDAVATKALEFIAADYVFNINIGDVTDTISTLVTTTGLKAISPEHEDLNIGNIKARQRMVVQYAIANTTNGMVVGTDHAAEAVMGFFTKYGDGATDVLPLSGLTKTQVRAMAVHLGAPTELAFKVPTADLSNIVTGIPDEQVFGVTYNDIDDFLMGRTIDVDAASKIIKQYDITAHKRALPVAV